MYRIPLQVIDVDLSDDTTIGVIGLHLSDLVWTEVGGRVLAVIYSDVTDPIGLAVETARRIENHLGARVREVDQDLVNTSDIAQRFGVKRETVRTWVEGTRGPGHFPASVGSPGVGDRSRRIWRWADVYEWLHSYYKFEEEERVLSRHQTVALNAALQRIHEHLDTEWQLLGSPIENHVSFSQSTETARVPLNDSLPRHVRWKLVGDIHGRPARSNHDVLLPLRVLLGEATRAASALIDNHATFERGEVANG
ncbi:hypothetical protein [Catellatospora sichuanensis]|uniref:hypothetical protein n=1 Tax=Catellatospora sichuanensis TaxID=1969805 RepID=UPI00118344D6|nr:hypothetical protein [Catellatospora sichuanensis]